MGKGKETFTDFASLAAKYGSETQDEKKTQGGSRNNGGGNRNPNSGPKGNNRPQTQSGNRGNAKRNTYTPQGGGFQKKPPAPSRSVASAPYNFVPFPAAVLPAPLNEEDGAGIREKYASYIKREGKYSGVIELDIETKTPFFIGAGKNENFFAPLVGNPVIPGSTIRGMVKNIMKVLACGAMRPAMRKDVESKEVEGDGDFFDHKLYFRAMAAAAGSGVRENYEEELLTRGANGRMKSVAQAGYLIRCTNKKHYICPAKDKDLEGAGKGPAIEWGSNGRAECFTGFMFRKNVHTLHYDPQWNIRYEVEEKVVNAYFDDSTRQGFNLLEDKSVKRNEAARKFSGCSDVDFVAPCFYIRREGMVRHFGFGRYYRIPYRLSIGEHVPSRLKDRTPDFTDALFGRKEDWGSRLFFEDCTPVEGTARPMGKTFNCILGTPKPTSAQLYLEQKGGGPKTWNDDVPIRGYKFYWHQQNEGAAWEKHTQAKPSKVTTSMRPIASGAKFQGRIRFERLSEIELGALLKVFELSSFAEAGEELCFKLGRGKSIGMGSVKINATLRLLDRKAYATLFGGDAWNEGLTEAQSLRSYTQKFDDYLNEKLDKTARTQYDISQKALIAMLDWKKTELPKWETETAMMTLESKNFKPDIILPIPADVVARAKAKQS
jgi:CRISPR/Cas system CSM-associated protein Csm3 (group 7 of RAMP superfamily)